MPPASVREPARVSGHNELGSRQDKLGVRHNDSDLRQRESDARHGESVGRRSSESIGRSRPAEARGANGSNGDSDSGVAQRDASPRRAGEPGDGTGVGASGTGVGASGTGVEAGRSSPEERLGTPAATATNLAQDETGEGTGQQLPAGSGLASRLTPGANVAFGVNSATIGETPGAAARGLPSPGPAALRNEGQTPAPASAVTSGSTPLSGAVTPGDGTPSSARAVIEGAVIEGGVIEGGGRERAGVFSAGPNGSPGLANPGTAIHAEVSGPENAHPAAEGAWIRVLAEQSGRDGQGTHSGRTGAETAEAAFGALEAHAQMGTAEAEFGIAGEPDAQWSQSDPAVAAESGAGEPDASRSAARTSFEAARASIRGSGADASTSSPAGSPMRADAAVFAASGMPPSADGRPGESRVDGAGPSRARGNRVSTASDGRTAPGQPAAWVEPESLSDGEADASRQSAAYREGDREGYREGYREGNSLASMTARGGAAGRAGGEQSGSGVSGVGVSGVGVSGDSLAEGALAGSRSTQSGQRPDARSGQVLTDTLDAGFESLTSFAGKGDPRAARALRVDLPGAQGEDAVRLRFLQRGSGAAAGIDVRIQSASEQTVREMRAEIPALLQRLEQSGFRTAAPTESGGRLADDPGSSRDGTAGRDPHNASGSHGESGRGMADQGTPGDAEPRHSFAPGAAGARGRGHAQGFDQTVRAAIQAQAIGVEAIGVEGVGVEGVGADGAKQRPWKHR